MHCIIMSCQLAVHVMILHPCQRIAVIQNIWYSYIPTSAVKFPVLVSLLPVFGHAALLPIAVTVFVELCNVAVSPWLTF